RTLDRDDPYLLSAVDVDDRQIPRASTFLERLGGEHLAERRHVLEVRKHDPTLSAVGGQEPDIRREGHEVIGIFPEEPLGLLSDAGADAQDAAGSGREGKSRTVPPPVEMETVRVVVRSTVHATDGGKLRREVVRMPQAVAQHECLADHGVEDRPTTG